MSADVSQDRQTLLIHALDVDDPDALVAEIKQRYERPLKEIFECERQPFPWPWACLCWPGY